MAGIALSAAQLYFRINDTGRVHYDFAAFRDLLRRCLEFSFKNLGYFIKDCWRNEKVHLSRCSQPDKLRRVAPTENDARN